MGGTARLVACGLTLAGAGCLAAPPSADEAPRDCTAIVRNGFDDGELWGAYEEPGTSVSREPGQVRIISAPAEAEVAYGYASLRSEATTAVERTEVTARLRVHDSAGSIAGISFDNVEGEIEEEDDYADLAVSDGVLQAIRKAAGGDRDVLCAPDCPLYDPVLHARFRLRAEGGAVVYQSSPDGIEWTDIASAPIGELDYKATAFVFSNAPATGDLQVNNMEWARCE